MASTAASHRSWKWWGKGHRMEEMIGNAWKGHEPLESLDRDRVVGRKGQISETKWNHEFGLKAHVEMWRLQTRSLHHQCPASFRALKAWILAGYSTGLAGSFNWCFNFPCKGYLLHTCIGVVVLISLYMGFLCQKLRAVTGILYSILMILIYSMLHLPFGLDRFAHYCI